VDLADGCLRRDAFDQYEPLGNNQLEMVHDASRYLPTIERKLTWLEREAPRFDICLYNAGMDPFAGCSIGGMQGVTQKVLRDREVAVFSWCRTWGVPIAFVVAGGYLGPELECAGSSRSTGSLSKRRAPDSAATARQIEGGSVHLKKRVTYWFFEKRYLSVSRPLRVSS
jgi:hypothetical protein